MELIRGLVVIPRAGRDRGRPQAVVGVRDGLVLTADGGRRTLSRPKGRNPKHVQRTALRLSETELQSDRSLRRALARLEKGERSPADQPE